MTQEKKLTIGLQVVSLSDAYNNALIETINTASIKMNVNLILFLGGTPGNPNFKHEHHQRVIYDHINSGNIDAVITLTPTLRNYLSEEDFVALLNKFSSVPIISIGLDISKYIKQQSSILINSIKGFSDLIEHLILKQGHNHLAFISGPLQNPEAMLRFNTYKNMLAKHNIEVAEDNIYYGNFVSSDAKPAIKQFLSNKQRPDVIICSNDLCALGVIEELTQQNIRVPDQIAVTGFDDSEGSKNCNPPLSTVSQSFLQMGALALKLAVDHALKKNCQPVYELGTTFVRRQSCGVKVSQLDSNTIINELKQSVSSIIDKGHSDKTTKHHITEPVLYSLLIKIFSDILNNNNNDINLSFVEFEEFYISIILKRIKFDIKFKLGYTAWVNTLKKIESKYHSLIENSDIIQLLTLRIRGILAKEKSSVRETELSSRDNIYFVKDIAEEISDADTFEELSFKLREKYHQLSHFINLDNYVVLGYPKTIKKVKGEQWEEPNKIDTMLVFHEIENKDITYQKGLNSKILLPQSLAPKKDRYTIIAETIYSSDEQLGRVIYELYPSEINLFSCAMITTQIASTIRIIHQNIERIRSHKQISLLVSDLEEKNKLAEEAVIAKGHFLATMSHEIRTPMNGVLGIAELLKDTKLDEQQNQYLDIIKNSSHSLLNIISDILDFSKIEEGKLSVEHIDFTLTDLCNEVLSVFAFTSQQKNIVINLDIQKNVPTTIISDPSRLRQILINLIGNAFKFTTKGTITLKIEILPNSGTNFNKNYDTNNHLLKFSIIDTGIGILKENINKLFGAFNQADSTITRKFGGTGLGLSISKSLSELLGGEIGVHSNKNQGSTFWFSISSRLVASSQLSTAPKEETNIINDASFNNVEILIAEDNKVNQIVIKGMIKKLGAKATVVDNGQDAFIAYKNEIKKFSLIIMDFEMPILDGANATRKIRALENLINTDTNSAIRIPIIAITAHAMNEHRELCIESGMDDHLTKPIDLNTFEKALIRFL